MPSDNQKQSLSNLTTMNLTNIKPGSVVALMGLPDGTFSAADLRDIRSFLPEGATLWILPEGVTIEEVDEQTMNRLGWYKGKPQGKP